MGIATRFTFSNASSQKMHLFYSDGNSDSDLNKVIVIYRFTETVAV